MDHQRIGLKKVRGCASLFLATLFCLPAIAQNDLKPAAPGESTVGAELVSSSPEPKTLFGESFRGFWTFSGDGSIGQQYDDNAAASSGIRSSDSVSSFALRLSAGVKKKRLTFQ